MVIQEKKRGFLRIQTLNQGGSDVKGTRNGKIWYREVPGGGSSKRKGPEVRKGHFEEWKGSWCSGNIVRGGSVVGLEISEASRHPTVQLLVDCSKEFRQNLCSWNISKREWSWRRPWYLDM